MLVSGGNDRRIADVDARGTRAGDLGGGAGGGRSDQGHAGHGLEQHGRSVAVDHAGRPRKGPTRRWSSRRTTTSRRRKGFTSTIKALAEAVEIPICVYNIPGRTGKNIEPETIARLAECRNITMVKEATGSLDQASQILATTDLTVLSGDDSLTLPLLSVGGRRRDLGGRQHRPPRHDRPGPDVSVRRLGGAQQWHHKLFPLCRDMLGLATNPIPIKAAMQLLGRDTGELRLPMTPLDAAGLERLRATLTGYGLL